MADIKTKKSDVKTTLNSAELIEEGGQYYISAKYTVESEHTVKEIIVPRIKIPFCHYENTGVSIEHNTYYPPFLTDYRYCTPRVTYSINTGLGKLDLACGKIPGYDGEHYFIEKIIKEKKVDLTIEEIEKKLGYKIRVVGEKS